MWTAVVLVCSIALSPVECQPDTALDVISGPASASLAQCGMFGQAYIAETALADLSPDTYIKVRCTSSSVGKGNVG